MRSGVERQVESMQMQKQNGDADAVDLDAEDCTKNMYWETKGQVQEAACGDVPAFVKSKVWGSDIDMWLCFEMSCTLLHAIFTALLDRGQPEV